MKVYFVFIFSLFFLSELIPSNKGPGNAFGDFSVCEVLDLIFRYDLRNIFIITATNANLYGLTFFSIHYQELLQEKAKNLCRQNICKYWDSTIIDFPLYKKRRKKRRYRWKNLIEYQRLFQIIYYYKLYHGEFFMNYAHELKTFKGIRLIGERFADFFEKNKDQIEHTTSYCDIENTEDRILFLTYTLLEKNKKIVLIDFPKNNWHIQNNIWMDNLEKDNSITRVVFVNFNFNLYVPAHFLANLKNTILYKTIVQDCKGNTYFHKECLDKNLSEIKRFPPCYYDVCNNEGKTGISLIQEDSTGETREILKYLNEKGGKSNSGVTKKKPALLSTRLND